MFVDPELDNFTYELRNEADLPDFVSEVLASDRDRAAAHMYELKTDVVLRSEIEASTRGRLSSKRVPEYGHRLAWYAFVRELKPSLVVETGIQDGLSSIVLLRALERNDEEGSPGRLKSFDIMPGSGWLVGERHRPNWQLTIGSTYDTLEPALEGGEVGVIIHDSENTYESEQFEFGVALRHAADRLLLMTNRAPVGGLRDFAAEHGLRYVEFVEEPLHFYPGTPQGAALYRRT
jgi:hypothetical protein